MASRLPELERERLIELSGRLAKEGMGVNEIARYLLEKENIKISAPSVSSFIKVYQNNHFSEEVDYTLKNNRGDISNITLQKRVLENARLLLSGKTVKKIAEETGEDYYKVYRDLTIRLSKIDEKLAFEVNQKLNNNREENRKNARKNK